MSVFPAMSHRMMTILTLLELSKDVNINARKDVEIAIYDRFMQKSSFRPLMPP